MKKKVIKNTFLLLLVPIIITIIICLMYRRKLENVFYDPINYDSNNNTIITDKYPSNYTNGYYSTDFLDYDSIIKNISKNYKIYLYFGITLVFIFFLMYSYVIKNKKW